MCKYVKEGLKCEDDRDFGITFTDRNVTIDQVIENWHLKSRIRSDVELCIKKKAPQVLNINVLRDLVYAVMYDVKPDAMEQSVNPCEKKKPK